MSPLRLLRRIKHGHRWPSLASKMVVLRDLECLMIALDWKETPLLGDAHLAEYAYPEDANHRRLRDAEVVGAACRNVGKNHLLEIGTSIGHMTAIMARNAPDATIHTVNIPPEDIAAGGTLVTHAPQREQIGSYYREQGFRNVSQILANTATWQPQLPQLDVAFIDGCHDTKFVLNDTRKIIKLTHPGSIIMWHDCNPTLSLSFPWIGNVCEAIEQLIEGRELKGRFYLVQDSWTLLYRIT